VAGCLRIYYAGLAEAAAGNAATAAVEASKEATEIGTTVARAQQYSDVSLKATLPLPD